MAELRAAGRDVSEGGKNAEIRAVEFKERWASSGEWDAEGEHADREVFRREILLHL